MHVHSIALRQIQLAERFNSRKAVVFFASITSFLIFLIAFEILILLSFIYQENSASDLRMDILALRKQHTSKTQTKCPFTALTAFIFDCIYATEMPDS